MAASIRSQLALAVIGMLGAYGALLALSHSTPATGQYKQIILISLLAVGAVVVLAMGVGLIVARALLAAILPLLDASMSGVQLRLKRYERSPAWPSRRFLDLLRETRLSATRREFFKLGLDRGLRLPRSWGIGELEQYASVLQTLELESNFKGLADLQHIAANAKNLLRSVQFRVRFRTIVVWASVFGACAAASLLIMATVDGSFEGTAHVAPTIDAVRSPPDFTGATSGSFTFALLSVVLVAAAPVSAWIIGQLLFFSSWSIGKRTSTQVDDILLLAVSWFAAGLVGVVLLYIAAALYERWPAALQDVAAALVVVYLPVKWQSDSFPNVWLHVFDDIGRTRFFFIRAAAVLLATGVLIVLLRNATDRVLKQIAAKTQQRHDDMAVELVRIFGTFVLVALGGGWIFMIVVAEYGRNFLQGGDSNALLPYALVVGVLGAVLGVASRDMLENFFAGISLQVDRPFEPGERVTLQTGELCEVRSVGMRSTQFFKVLDHTDLYIPNSELARQSITNLSRPSREYRRCLRFSVRDFARTDDYTTLMLAERIALLAAFSVAGVDMPTVRDEQAEGAIFSRNREPVLLEFQKLFERHDEAAAAVIKSRGQPEPMPDAVARMLGEIAFGIEKLVATRSLRWDAQSGEPLPLSSREGLLGADPDRLRDWLFDEMEIARRVAYQFYELATSTHTLASVYPDLREEFQQLATELLHAPTVNSTQRITDSGIVIWDLDLTLYCYVTEDSETILHHLNLFIHKLAGILGLMAARDERVSELRTVS